MTIPEQAVQAAQRELSVTIYEWERRREFLNVSPALLQEFMRIKSGDLTASILSALEPSAADMGNPITDKTVKRRIADALEYVWSALDCDVEHIDSIIAHMQGNDLYVIESQNYRRMAEAVQKASAYLALTQPNSAAKIISDLDTALKPEVGIPATEPSTASKMEVVADLPELLERLDAGLEYEGELETKNDYIELFNVEAAQDLFADAAAAIRALHPQADKPSEDGAQSIERGKFYHHQWPMGKLLEARRDGLVDHSGGEAWRYEYSHKDENGKYDILYRPVKNSTIPARLPTPPAGEVA